MSLDTRIADAAAPPIDRSARRAWLITAMLVLLALVNWMDKAVLGLVAVPLMEDLNIGPGEYGTLASAIYFFFSLSAIGAGFLANRRSVKWLLFFMVGIWSLSQFAIWLAPTFAVILLARIVLGLGEGPSAGLSFHAAGKWFRDHERNVPVALQNVGSFGGIAVAAPGLTWVVAHHGWHAAFFAVGVAGLVWMAIWYFIGKEGPYSGSSKAEAAVSVFDSHARVPYRQILLSRSFIGAAAVGLAAYWALAIVSAWLPAYLRKAQGYTAEHASNVVMSVSLTAIFFLLTQALITHHLMKRGVSTRVARGWMAAGSVAIAGLFIMLSVAISPGSFQTFILSIGFGLGLTTFTTSAVLISEFVPVLQRGAVLGIYVATVTLSGVICPSVFGWIVQGRGADVAGYHTAFLASGALVLVGGIVGLLLINPPREAARIAYLIEATR